MTAWALIRRAGTGAAVPLSLFLLFLSPVRADEPAATKPKLTVAELRAAAEAAEKSGDWETAFTAYCHLFVADRSAPDVREKLNVALRRCQQLRRHRDPQFQQFAGSTSVPDALNLFEEVMTRVPVVYVERDRSTPQILWENGVEELTRALGNPAFRQAFLNNPTPDKVEWFRTTLRLSWAKQTISDAKAARRALQKLIIEAQDRLGLGVVRVPSALVLEVVCGACGGLDEYT